MEQTEGGASQGETEPRSIYDGFEGYRTPALEDYRGVLREGMVVPDANVLLNLYRYTDQARDDLLSVMERLGGQLWVPHQVLAEFWRNRDLVLRDPRETERIKREMSGQQEESLRAFRTWANRVSLPSDRATELVDELTRGFGAVLGEVERFNDSSAVDAARDTGQDEVLAKLEALLEGQVGKPFEEGAHARAVAEGLRRVAEREPPGYLDKDKEDSGAAGDYLVWEQILVEAERRRCDVVFVTADVKEDWWRKEAGELRGPRLELVDELRSRAQSRLFMLRPTRLLELAPQVLEVAVRDESVQDADRVERLLSVVTTNLTGGWNLEAVESLLAQLREEEAVQGRVIEEAARSGGYIEREKVYEIGGYDENRQLKGFTRPVNRISRLLREEGQIEEGAVDPLVAVYDLEAENPSEAAGFEIDLQVLPLVISAMAR